MMAFFKIFQIFFTPSTNLLVFFILGIIFIKRIIGKILLVVAIIIYYLFSITPISDLIIFPLENKYEPIDENSLISDTIVLLAGGLRGEEKPITSVLAESALFRTIEAVHLYNKLKEVNQNAPVKIIISGTNKIYPQKREAYFMGKLLENLNIPREDILLEEESANTYESAENIEKILREKQFLLVTSAYHMPRSIYLFKKFETNPIPAPCDYLNGLPEGYNIFDFFPNLNNLKKVDTALHEYLGILVLKFPKIYEIFN